MAYVQPNGIVQVGTVNGLDNRYLHTLYFASTTDQETFMSTHLTKSFDKTSYLRNGADCIKVQTPYQNVYNCNYMRFKNQTTTSGSSSYARDNKWYYAFILNVEYINESTTAIYYQIDEMQTWFVGATVNACMVLREHDSSDDDYMNLESEPCGSDAYDRDFITNDSYLNSSYGLLINATGKSTETWTGEGELVSIDKISGYSSGLVNGTWLGCIKPINISSQEQATALGTSLIESLWEDMKGNWNTGDSPIEMLSMYMVPADYVEVESDATVSWNPVKHTIEFDRPDSYDNFKPENNKMYTYPFSFCTVTNNNGQVADYRWEYFDGDMDSKCEIRGYATCGNGMEIMYAPLDYNGVDINLDQKLTISDFPMCAFSYDSYQAWLASGGDTKAKTERNYAIAGSVMNFVGSAVGIGNSLNTDYQNNWESQYNDYTNKAIAGRNLNQGALNAVNVGATNYANASAGVSSAMAITAAVQAGVSAVNTGISISQSITKCNYTFKDAAYQPRSVVGTTAVSSMTANKLNSLSIFHTHIRDDEAKRVDEFLTAFGYAVNRFKVPNFTGRKYWNFVQTKLSSISGNMPAASMTAICNILDGGITFWHGDYIGNYRIGYDSASNKGVITNPIT